MWGGNSTVPSGFLGQITAGGEQGFKPPTYKHALKQKANATKHWHPSTMYSEEGERPLHVDRSV